MKIGNPTDSKGRPLITGVVSNAPLIGDGTEGFPLEFTGIPVDDADGYSVVDGAMSLRAGEGIVFSEGESGQAVISSIRPSNARIRIFQRGIEKCSFCLNQKDDKNIYLESGGGETISVDSLSRRVLELESDSSRHDQEIAYLKDELEGAGVALDSIERVV